MANQVTTFIEYLIDGNEAIQWLKSYKRGPQYLGIFGAIADATTEADTQALTSGWIAHPNFPDDAAHMSGIERRLPKYPGETMANYKLRLHRAWTIWGTAGSRTQLIAELAAYGFTGAFIVATHEWNGTGGFPAWSTPAQDAEKAKWCRYWVYVPVGGHSVAKATFGSGRKFGDGLVFGADNLSRQQIIDIRDIFDRFGAAHEQAVEIRFLITAGTFTAPTVWSGQSVAINLLYAQQ